MVHVACMFIMILIPSVSASPAGGPSTEVLGGRNSSAVGQDASDEPVSPPVLSVEEETDSRVLAEANGLQGLIQVLESGGVRRLVIDGVVQAAVAVEEGQVRPGKDPMVELIAAIWGAPLIGRGLGYGGYVERPTARTGKKSLLIGLGTGLTATALRRAGFEVDAVELEPAVIDFAKRYFNYRGQAQAIEGRRFLDATKEKYDLVLVDAATNGGLPHQLTSEIAFTLLQDALRDDEAVIAVRLFGSPSDPKTQDVQRLIKERFSVLFGSGIADEPQNLYWLTAPRALNLTNGRINGISLLDAPNVKSSDSMRVNLESIDRDPDPAVRKVTVFGYLTRDNETQDLFVDLPWNEMGAARYLLEGPEGTKLAALLDDNSKFPTKGGIASDSDTNGTLLELFGGGGTYGSSVRYSRVAVAVEGEASIVALLNPNFMPHCLPEERWLHFSFKFVSRGELLCDSNWDDVHPSLPYGGILYRMQVEKVNFVLTRANWDRSHARRLAPKVRRAADALSKGKLVRASKAVRPYLKRLNTLLGRYAVGSYPMTEVARLAACIDEEKDLAAGRLATFDRAAMCDRALDCAGDYVHSADGKDLRMALWKCAVGNYRKVVATSDSHLSRMAASRVLDLLYEWGRYDSNWSGQGYYPGHAATEPEREALKKRFPDLRDLDDPPSLGGETPPLRNYTEWYAHSSWSAKKRVRHARTAKLQEVEELLARVGVSFPPRRLLLRVFKREEVVEVWAASRDRGPLVHAATYAVCAMSGKLGPKRRAGDYQVPEGFYHLDYYNRRSAFHLSFRVNYPNDSDRILGAAGSLGGDIMFHGNCVSIGCVSMGDERIEELWVMTRSLADEGRKVHVHMLPARDMAGLIEESDDAQLTAFWSNLKEGDDLFRKNRTVPSFVVNASGGYEFGE